MQPEVRQVLAAMRGSLEAAGCVVTDAAPVLTDADEVFQVLRAARMAAAAPLLRDHREQVKATLAWNIEKGLALTGEQIAVAREGQAEIFRRFASFLADGPYDVLALPTVQVLPFPVEQEWVTEINGEPQATYIDWMRSCSRITVTLHPAITVPAGLATPGRPPGGAPAGPAAPGPLRRPARDCPSACNWWAATATTGNCSSSRPRSWPWPARG